MFTVQDASYKVPVCLLENENFIWDLLIRKKSFLHITVKINFKRNKKTIYVTNIFFIKTTKSLKSNVFPSSSLELYFGYAKGSFTPDLAV